MERVRGELTGLCTPLALIIWVAACGGSADTGRLSDPGPQVAAVGQELTISLDLAAVQGQVAYDFEFDKSVAGPARIVARPDGSALFTFRPTGKDIGELSLRAVARDEIGAAETVIPISVRSTIGAATVPRFQRPQGEGTALEIAENDCVEVDILIDDQDTSSVDLVEVEPVIEGGTLQDLGGGEAVWRWCPTPAQRAERSRYVLTLGADDRENPKSLKRYLIVLHDGEKLGCPGTAPSLTHAAADHESLDSIEVRADVTDTEGLAGAPLVYFFVGDQFPTKLDQAEQLTMSLLSGDDRRGEWVAHIPNPALDAPAGQSVSLTYAIVVNDNDGRGNGCDHVTTERFTVKVIPPEPTTGLGACEPCDADVQCGGPGDLCLSAGSFTESFCFTSCDSDDDCGSGFYCSPEPLTSVDGAEGRQCVPEDDVCEVVTCEDDRYEPNGRAAAALAIEPGLTDELMMCPIGHLASDEDWYKIELTEDSEIELELSGDVYPNLELRLFDANGLLVAASEDWGSFDSISRCLPAGEYYARVYSNFAGENPYTLELSTTPGTCPVAECIDDAFEDDDSLEEGDHRIPDFEGSVYRQPSNYICTGDQDWYYVFLFGGETIYGTLEFEQTTPNEDLDFLVYDGTGLLLTPCTPDDLSGCTENGQSGTSNETFEFTAPGEGGDFFIVVNGFDGAENSYGICLGLNDPALCP
jgi:hypothetical protein